jgi:hypothetical protein
MTLTASAYADLVKRNVRAHGFHFTWVGADETPCFCYSTGVYETQGLPELIVSSLPPSLSGELMRSYVRRFRDSSPPIATRIAKHESDRFDYYLIAANFDKIRDYVLASQKYYGGVEVPYLQLVYPDTDGRFPHEPGYDYDQEIFGDYARIAPLP